MCIYIYIYMYVCMYVCMHSINKYFWEVLTKSIIFFHTKKNHFIKNQTLENIF